MYSIVVGGICLCLCLSQSDSARAQSRSDNSDINRWERYVRGFRQDHNFTLLTGASSGVWQVKRFGSIEGKNYSNRGIFGKFTYSYHIKLLDGLGYVLGSSFGYHFETADKRSEFAPASGYMLPGVLLGFVYNFSALVRFGLSGEYYLERHDDIEERDTNEDEDYTISVNIQTVDFSSYLDFFYDISWAFRLEVHNRLLTYKPPDNVDRRDDLNANFKKRDLWVGLGVVYHSL